MTTSREKRGSLPEPDRRGLNEDLDRRRLRGLNETLDLLELNLNQPPTGSRPQVIDLLVQLRSEINQAYAAPGSRDEP